MPTVVEKIGLPDRFCPVFALHDADGGFGCSIVFLVELVRPPLGQSLGVENGAVFFRLDRFFKGGHFNQDGVMITDSPRAMAMAANGQLDVGQNEVAANLRVADPGLELDTVSANSLKRSTRPLTVAVADATNGASNVRVEAYKNYAGIGVVGAWRWHPEWELGVVIEHNANDVFAAARIVRIGFVVLGSLLFLTAFIAATRIASKIGRAHV